MRHKKKRNRLGLPADQRRALLRTLTTQVLRYGKVQTTEARAKAVKEHVEHMITLAKRGNEDLAAHRLVSSFLLEHRASKSKTLESKAGDVDLERYRVVKADDKNKEVKVREKTVAQRLFETIAPRYADRNGGYVRLVRMPPRQGDAAPMALIELV